MIINAKTKKDRLEFFSNLFCAARSAYQPTLQDLDRCMEQYRGSAKIDGSNEDAITVRNITYEIIESQISSDIPMPKADPISYSEHRSRNAMSIERLCRSIRDKLPFEELNDIDERYTYIYGGSVWYVEWDNSSEEKGEIGCVKVHCLSPKDFIPQPGVYNVEDMEYCFLCFTTTRAEVSRQYGMDISELSDAEYDYEFSDIDPDGNVMKVTVAFYKDEDGNVGKFVFSGNTSLSDIPKYYMRKTWICADCGSREDQCTCQKKKLTSIEIPFEVLENDIVLDNGVKILSHSPSVSILDGKRRVSLEKTRIPYYIPASFPIVIRKNTSGEKSLLGQSDCDYIRPQQQSINKIESRILKKLLRAGITPIVPEDASVSINNSVFGQVIKMKPGESAAQYGKIDMTPDISQDVLEAERLYDQAKRIIGITDALQGIDNAQNESGYARQLKISQASGRLESKRKMKYTAYAAIDKIIFNLYLAFADEPRHLSYKDVWGRIHKEEFNRYSFIEYDLRRGDYYYDDSYLFSVDLNGGSEYQREALWQRNLENLKAGTLGDPENPTTLLRYWQCQERAHYPYARENVEHFASIIKEGGESRVEDDTLAVY